MPNPYNNVIKNQVTAKANYPALLHSAAAVSAGTFAHGATIATVVSWKGPGTAAIVGPDLVISGGAVWDVVLLLDAVESRYPCAEAFGTILYDVNVPSAHLTAATTATRASQAKAVGGAMAWNVNVGHALYTNVGLDRLYVPFTLAGGSIPITPPTGFSLVRFAPPSDTEMPECGVETDVNYFLQVAGGVTDDYVPGDTPLPADQNFASEIDCNDERRAAGRFLLTDTAQTGADRDSLENYTANRDLCIENRLGQPLLDELGNPLLDEFDDELTDGIYPAPA